MIDPELSREYFEYLNPSDMHENLNKIIGSEKTKAKVNVIKNKLANLMEPVKRSPTSDTKKFKNRNNMLKIVESVLEFKQLNQ